MVKIVYSVFLGILLAVFVGIGIAAFYSAPAPPRAPDFGYVTKDGLNQQQQLEQTAFDKARAEFDKNKQQPYNRNVSIITLMAAVIFVAIGLALSHRINVLADGALLGGVFTLLYSLGRGFASDNPKYVFLVVSISLAVAIYLGYRRFIRTPKAA